jgi:hypothetical protein
MSFIAATCGSTSFINDKRITVYIARDNPKKYAMDVSFLPACADG